MQPDQKPRERAWDLADRKIRRYQEAIRKAERGEGRANPQVCREQIDRWLDYRSNHGPNDERAEL
jgi:hypothetical protein